MNEYQVPLVERLKSVPNDARFVQQEEFSSGYYPVGTLCHQAADRIAELEKKHTTLQTQFDNLYELANSGNDMNTEPVAWMDKRTNKCVVFINTPPSDDWIPLYAHPVKELTDEEILNLFEPKYDAEIDDEMLIDFARAILRKAQE